MSAPRVLFVDDDAQLIAGLRRAMRKHRDRWEIVFAVGGPAGLAEVRGSRFDVVVSDLKMPGVDGATLLREVRAVQPDAYRIVLSGFIEPNSIVRTDLLAHAFLDKPCDTQTIVDAIDRGLAERAPIES